MALWPIEGGSGVRVVLANPVRPIPGINARVLEYHVYHVSIWIDIDFYPGIMWPLWHTTVVMHAVTWPSSVMSAHHYTS